MKRFFQFAQKRDARQTLAEPSFRPTRVIRGSLSRPKVEPEQQIAPEGEPVT